MSFSSALFDNLGDNCIQNVHFREDITRYRAKIYLFLAMHRQSCKM